MLKTKTIFLQVWREIDASYQQGNIVYLCFSVGDVYLMPKITLAAEDDDADRQAKKPKRAETSVTRLKLHRQSIYFAL